MLTITEIINIFKKRLWIKAKFLQVIFFMNQKHQGLAITLTFSLFEQGILFNKSNDTTQKQDTFNVINFLDQCLFNF